MKYLYLLSQDINDGYDTYDSCIVCATSRGDALKIDPSGYYKYHDDNWYFQYSDKTEKIEENDEWCNPKNVNITLVGIADEKVKLNSVVCASFNAG